MHHEDGDAGETVLLIFVVYTEEVLYLKVFNKEGNMIGLAYCRMSLRI